MELAILIEGQKGLTWRRLERIARTVEDLGFAALYRSDHITNSEPPDQEALELWVSLAWLATHTRRIEFGPLVTPLSMHHPVQLARMGRDVDDLSGGRLQFGLGAGWMAREHKNYGFELLPLSERFDRFREGLTVIRQLMKSETPSDFSGKYYTLKDAVLLPRPGRPGGPPLVIGGRGMNRTPRLVADFADEWNIFRVSMETLKQLLAQLERLLAERERPLDAVRRSMMVNVLLGENDAGVKRQMDGMTYDQWREKGVVGTPNQIVDQIGDYAELGICRVILQHFDLDNLDKLEQIARHILPQVI